MSKTTETLSSDIWCENLTMLLKSCPEGQSLPYSIGFGLPWSTDMFLILKEMWRSKVCPVFLFIWEKEGRPYKMTGARLWPKRYILCENKRYGNTSSVSIWLNWRRNGAIFSSSEITGKPQKRNWSQVRFTHQVLNERHSKCSIHYK